MKIVTSSYALDLTGVPTFTLTLYNELVKRGHEVTVYSPLSGPLEAQMKVVRSINEVQTPDVIIAQHYDCAEALKVEFPDTLMVFYSHGLLPDGEQPPNLAPDWYLAVNEEVRDNLQAKGVPAAKISIVRDFIDTSRFKPTGPINREFKKVLFISNYKKWKNYQAVSGACQILGVDLKCFGSPYGRNYQIEEAINDADLIISWGRGILEAMACERAALSFDRFEGDGYITAETYLESRKNNFSGRIYKHAFTADSLTDEIKKYKPDDGPVNRGLVEKYHDSVKGTQEILDIIEKIRR